MMTELQINQTYKILTFQMWEN